MCLCQCSGWLYYKHWHATVSLCVCLCQCSGWLYKHCTACCFYPRRPGPCKVWGPSWLTRSGRLLRAGSCVNWTSSGPMSRSVCSSCSLMCGERGPPPPVLGTSRWEHVDVLRMYQQVRTCGCLMHVPAGENMWMSYAHTSRWEYVDVLCMYQQVRTCGCLMHVAAGENTWMSYACSSRWEHMDVLCMQQQVRTCGCLMHVPAGENMWMSYACASRWKHMDVLCMYQQVKTCGHLMHVPTG